MKNQNEILNVPTIQKDIREKHQAFIKKFGVTVEKVMADHRLFADIVMAKLNRILLVFKEEGIIDEAKVVDTAPYKKIVISKNGYDAYIDIETDGVVMSLQGHTYINDQYDPAYRHFLIKPIRGINEEGFDWVAFSSELLDYIHNTIYARKEVVEQRISGMFKNIIPKDRIAAKK